MKYFVNLMCTTFACLSLNCFAAEVVPFPEVIPAEKNKPENVMEDLGDSFPLIQSVLHYHPEDEYLYRLHKNAYYHPVASTDSGNILQLHDASKWFIRPWDRHIVQNWVANDNVFIMPQSSWFSFYRYVLHNYTTNQSVETNLADPSFFMGAATFKISNIDFYNRLIELNDRTVWQMDYDSNFTYWSIGQRVLVGVNNNWTTSTFPNILINIDMAKEPYIQADFYGHSVGY